MEKPHLITGQHVSQELLNRARELRRNMTHAERRLWKQLRANRLKGWHFRRQQIIQGLIVDFYCHKAGLVIEVDGPIHDSQQMEDSERTRILNSLGLNVIRFTNRQVMNDMQDVLAGILAVLKKKEED